MHSIIKYIYLINQQVISYVNVLYILKEKNKDNVFETTVSGKHGTNEFKSEKDYYYKLGSHSSTINCCSISRFWLCCYSCMDTEGPGDSFNFRKRPLRRITGIIELLSHMKVMRVAD